jgi:tRNA(Ile)-lysidine synthetase-like protein
MKSIEKNDPVLSKVRAYLRKVPLPKDSILLLAISGGVDSTALAIALKELDVEFSFSLILGYFNHRLRSMEEEQTEISFVSALASRLEVPLLIGEAERGSIASQASLEKRSVEEVAREYRYRFLGKTAKEQGADFLVTAHTASDNEETQILRVLQGSSPAGLRGIPWKDRRILRPFIRVTRDEIVDFLRTRGVEPLEDRSNRDLRFLRNAVRHRLIPLIREIFPGYRTALKRLSIKMGWVEEFLQEELSRRDPWKSTDKGWTCRVEEFYALPPILRLYSLYRLFDRTRPTTVHRFPFAFLLPLIQISPGNNLRGVWEKGNLHIRIERGRLYWESNIVQKKKKGYLYFLEGKMRFTIADTLEIEVCPVEKGTFPEKGEVFDRGAYQTLFLRSKRPGDTIHLNRGKKSVKKLLSELHLPARDREEVPILQGDTEVLAVFSGAYGLPTLRSKSAILDPLKDRGKSNLITIHIHRIRGGEGSEQSE